jgi:NADH dehydrogenase FAD-containing subunit
MFSFSFLSKKNFISTSVKYFSNHSKIIVIGAGTGGISVSRQLENTGLVKPNEITIFDPEKIHHYQPGWTKIGGGVITNNYMISNIMKMNTSDLTKGLNFKNLAVKQINPNDNCVTTDNGEKWTYDHLIISAGIKINLNSIPGFYELYKDPNKMVTTIYDYEGALKMATMRKTFKGGRALFTQPPPPIKCGGAPQKMAYLCKDYWDKTGIKSDVHFFTPLPQMFAVDYYSKSLLNIAKEKGITPHFTSVLIGLKDGVATFKNTANYTIFEESYDLIHVTPHMAPFDFLKGSPVSNEAGFVDVDNTLRHKRFANIWALGDCIALPQAKTAAAVFSQVPVLVENLKCDFEGKKSSYRYDGYSSCPLFVSNSKLLLAEFREYNNEKGELVREVDESIHKGQQNVPRRLYYYITKSFAAIYYYLAMKGKWFGKHSVIRPRFENFKDHRYLYKYGVYSLYVMPLILFGVYSMI